MAARRASSQLLSSRCVHLRIQPRPANLSESREIFRVLQRFGDISTYRSLRYEYHNPADNIAQVIYGDADSAQKALSASPIRFALEKVLPEDGEEDAARNDDGDDEPTTRPETPSDDGVDEMLQPSRLLARETRTSSAETRSAPTPTPPRMPYDDRSSPKETKPKWFQVTVDRSRAIHQDFVERQPYWKQFSPMKSLAQADLAKSVPHIGLSDVSKRPLHHHRTPNKVLREMSHYVENHMPTLRQLYEEGGREKKVQ
ncbi:hypothetical protein EJ04DRAFT_537065 [Polyplosphaeria fusca]|uniref:Uncharacterized protein n=1 Tax=Polyplosphaeria fusca TaxID=682080 RepID=A0A9P4UW62_9PLEO|nr:hypothetical protein EJ04DRAFT_537065 [Polyplosphaeria fusca]